MSKVRPQKAKASQNRARRRPEPPKQVAQPSVFTPMDPSLSLEGRGLADAMIAQLQEAHRTEKVVRDTLLSNLRYVLAKAQRLATETAGEPSVTAETLSPDGAKEARKIARGAANVLDVVRMAAEGDEWAGRRVAEWSERAGLPDKRANGEGAARDAQVAPTYDGASDAECARSLADQLCVLVTRGPAAVHYEQSRAAGQPNAYWPPTNASWAWSDVARLLGFEWAHHFGLDTNAGEQISRELLSDTRIDPTDRSYETDPDARVSLVRAAFRLALRRLGADDAETQQRAKNLFRERSKNFSA